MGQSQICGFLRLKNVQSFIPLGTHPASVILTFLLWCFYGSPLPSLTRLLLTYRPSLQVACPSFICFLTYLLFLVTYNPDLSASTMWYAWQFSSDWKTAFLNSPFLWDTSKSRFSEDWNVRTDLYKTIYTMLLLYNKSTQVKR